MKRSTKLLLLVALLACITATWMLVQFSFGKIYPRHTIVNKPVNAYRVALHSFAEFKAMQGAPLSDKFSDVLSVKLVYDKSDSILYFVNSAAYRYHYDFCRLVLGDTEPLEVFNTLNYGNTGQRQYFLANLNYYEHANLYALEFSSEDQISAEDLAKMFWLVQEKTYLRDSLRLLAGADNLLRLDNNGRLPMPKLYPSDIYKEQQFQALNEGVAYGVLRNATDGGECTPQDIIVLKGTPVNVPVCAGIITNSFQTPLSHINILCHNRNIPSAVQTNLWELPQIKANMDEPVRMAVTMNGLSITPCSKAAVDSFIHARPAGRVVALHADLSVNRLVPVSEFDLDWKNTIGNKAAGLGRLNKIAAGFGSDFSIPEGAFAIPFYFFDQHMAAVTIKAAREKLETMQASGAGPEAIRAQLKVLRKTIKEQPLSPALLAAVKAMMQKNGYTSYRFRSSANAEDIAGFSGAGLYDSKTGKTDDAGKPVDMAIKKVWASVYNDNAYFERAAAGIDEHTVMMGILCHRNFPAETANGVAITRNLYRRNFPGYTVNVQVGEVPVVSPPDSVTCEQFVCMKANEVNPLNFDITTDYITYSNITKGQPVLRHKQVKQLYAALASVQKTYASDQALDIEFKFDNNGKLYLKQVRPYR